MHQDVEGYQVKGRWQTRQTLVGRSDFAMALLAFEPFFPSTRIYLRLPPGTVSIYFVWQGPVRRAVAQARCRNSMGKSHWVALIQELSLRKVKAASAWIL